MARIAIKSDLSKNNVTKLSDSVQGPYQIFHNTVTSYRHPHHYCNNICNHTYNITSYTLSELLTLYNSYKLLYSIQHANHLSFSCAFVPSA